VCSSYFVIHQVRIIVLVRMISKGTICRMMLYTCCDSAVIYKLVAISVVTYTYREVSADAFNLMCELGLTVEYHFSCEMRLDGLKTDRKNEKNGLN
jgi:hypothetical protein